MSDANPRRLRILLVDDQEGDLLQLRAALRALGAWDCELDWAASLPEAIAAYHARGAHDLYLLDYRLGRCTALDVRHELVALGCDAPVIVLSGFADPGDAEAALRAGAADFIDKQDLTPARLEQAIARALERSRAAQPAGGLSRELRELHALIIDAAEQALSRPGLDEGTRRQLRTVFGAATRAGEIARPLLEPARGRAVVPARASLGEVLTETVERLRGVLADDGVELGVRLEPLPPMTQQAAAVGQVVMNLALNACDALRGRAGARVEIECRADAAGALIEVRDNGPGIGADDLARVFEPFFSTKGELDVGCGGGGLGLSLCRTIVERHGGAITVRSAEGRGCAFVVRLPLDPAAAPMPMPDDQVRPSLLIVDDEPALRELWREALGESGWRVLEAPSGEAALALLAGQAVDAALVDLHLPGMSGADLVRALRERCPAIVAISGDILDGETAMLVDAALAKPVDLATIRDALADARRASRVAAR